MPARVSHMLIQYLFAFFLAVSIFPGALCGEYSQYPSYESKQYEFHHDYHPPPPKKAQVDINIPIDFGTIAKLGVIGLTQLKLLLALGKVAGAGLGVGALGLGSLGKLALSIGPSKGGIAIDIGGHHAKSSEQPQYYEHEHYVPEKRHYTGGKHHYRE